MQFDSFVVLIKEVIAYKKDSARKLEALVYNWARRQIHQCPQVAV